MPPAKKPAAATRKASAIKEGRRSQESRFTG
jgi:hypothetical protein